MANVFVEVKVKSNDRMERKELLMEIKVNYGKGGSTPDVLLLVHSVCVWQSGTRQLEINIGFLTGASTDRRRMERCCLSVLLVFLLSEANGETTKCLIIPKHGEFNQLMKLD